MPAQATTSKSGEQSIRGIYQAQRKYSGGFELSFYVPVGVHPCRRAFAGMTTGRCRH